MAPRRFDRTRFISALYRLDVRPPVTPASIVQAYRQKVKAHHPDRFLSEADKCAATVMLQEINDARDYITAHLAEALDFGFKGVWPVNIPPLRWTREDCARACAEYERIWPADPRD